MAAKIRPFTLVANYRFRHLNFAIKLCLCFPYMYDVDNAKLPQKRVLRTNWLTFTTVLQK